jgi:hypothetical protein
MGEDTASTFKDLGKNVKDLFERDFPENIVEVETETAVKPEKEAQKDAPTIKIKTNAIKKSDGVFAALDGPSLEFEQWGLNLKFSGNTEKKLLSAEGSAKPLKGLKVSMTAEAEAETRRMKTAVEYRHKHTALTGLFVFPFGKPPSLNGSGVMRYKEFSLGSEVECELGEEFKVKKHHYKGIYSARDDFAIGLYLTNDRPKEQTDHHWMSVAGLTLWNRPRKNIEFAVDVSQSPHDLGKSMPVLKLAGLYKLDNNSTIKTKFDTKKGRLGLSYRQKMSDFATLILGADLDVHNFGSNVDHKFGLKLNLNLNP